MSCDRRCFTPNDAHFGHEDCATCPGRDDGSKKCGKINDGHACRMPAGSECPDCCGIRGETIGLED